MRQLLETLRQDLHDLQSPPNAPFVYVTAIRSELGLTQALAKITLISRELGFENDAETTFSNDANSATYHARHRVAAVAMAVDVCPARQTVSLAVSGRDNAETYALFVDADQRLFGHR